MEDVQLVWINFWFYQYFLSHNDNVCYNRYWIVIQIFLSTLKVWTETGYWRIPNDVCIKQHCDVIKSSVFILFHFWGSGFATLVLFVSWNCEHTDIIFALRRRRRCLLEPEPVDGACERYFIYNLFLVTKPWALVR